MFMIEIANQTDLKYQRNSAWPRVDVVSGVLRLDVTVDH